MSAASPAAIILDWWNDPGSCGQEDKNKIFKDAIASAGRTTPLVFVRGTEISEDGSLVSEPDLLDNTGVNFGLTRLNCDVRKIPLSWPVLSPAGLTNVPSLAIEGIRVSKSGGIPEQSPLLQIIADNHDPYVSYFFDHVPQASARDLFCRGGTISPNGQCAGGTQEADLPELLRGKIVLISDVTATMDDWYESPAGRVPGAVLHANYIESLIADNVLKPVPVIFQIAASCAWFVVIELIFKRYERRPWLATGLVAGATFALAITFYYAVVVLLHFYFVLVVPSILYLITKAAEPIGQWAKSLVRSRG
jgi:hypothetical protein